MTIRELFTPLPEIRSERLVLRPLTRDDAPAVEAMIRDDSVYRYAPKNLFERRFTTARDMIDHLYTDGLKESLILGVFEDGVFRALAEFYGYNERLLKISLGYRSTQESWGRGIATEAVKLMVEYLENNTDIETITASTLPQSLPAKQVLINNGFDRVAKSFPENWGYDQLLPTDKWIR